MFGLALAGALLASEEQAFRTQLSLILLLGFCICPFLGGDLEARLLVGSGPYSADFISVAVAPLDFIVSSTQRTSLGVFRYVDYHDGRYAAYFVGRRFGKMKTRAGDQSGKNRRRRRVATCIGGILCGLIGAAYLFSNVSSVEALALSAALSYFGTDR